MPVYDYHCSDCGIFSDLRSMALSKEPCDCPDCGQSAPRVFVTAPNYSLMDSSIRTAHSTNERAKHAPKNTKSGPAHGPGCSCCTSSKSMPTRTLHRPDGSKAFPSARPWMISH